MNTDRSTVSLGRQGELIARNYLEALGWRVLATNYRCGAGELDMIASDPETGHISFIEVKTRRGAGHGTAAESVTPGKQRKLRAAALEWLGGADCGPEEPACRFDVVEVYLEGSGRATVKLRRGAFIPAE